MAPGFSVIGMGGMMLCWLTWAETARDGDNVVHHHHQTTTPHHHHIKWGPTGLAHLLTWHCQVVLVVWHVVVVVSWSSIMMVWVAVISEVVMGSMGHHG